MLIIGSSPFKNARLQAYPWHAQSRQTARLSRFGHKKRTTVFVSKLLSLFGSPSWTRTYEPVALTNWAKGPKITTRLLYQIIALLSIVFAELSRFFTEASCFFQLKPDMDKEISDSHALKPVLSDFFAIHPNMSFSTLNVSRCSEKYRTLG